MSCDIAGAVLASPNIYEFVGAARAGGRGIARPAIFGRFRFWRENDDNNNTIRESSRPGNGEPGPGLCLSALPSRCAGTHRCSASKRAWGRARASTAPSSATHGPPLICPGARCTSCCAALAHTSPAGSLPQLAAAPAELLRERSELRERPPRARLPPSGAPASF